MGLAWARTNASRVRQLTIISAIVTDVWNSSSGLQHTPMVTCCSNQRLCAVHICRLLAWALDDNRTSNQQQWGLLEM